MANFDKITFIQLNDRVASVEATRKGRSLHLVPAINQRSYVKLCQPFLIARNYKDRRTNRRQTES